MSRNRQATATCTILYPVFAIFLHISQMFTASVSMSNVPVSLHLCHVLCPLSLHISIPLCIRILKLLLGRFYSTNKKQMHCR